MSLSTLCAIYRYRNADVQNVVEEMMHCYALIKRHRMKVHLNIKQQSIKGEKKDGAPFSSGNTRRLIELTGGFEMLEKRKKNIDKFDSTTRGFEINRNPRELH